MPDYKEMYLILYRAFTKATAIMQAAQAETEELYMRANEPLHLADNLDKSGEDAEKQL